MTAPRARSPIGPFLFPAFVVIAVLGGVMAQVTTGSPRTVGIWVFLLVIAGWVITLCLHEFAHSVVALAGGDTSVRARGYLTLNPLKYTDPVFSIVIPLVLLAVGGIPLPGGAVLIEHYRLRSRAWQSLVSAAGPATNLICGFVLTLLAGAVAGDGVTGLSAGLAFLAVLQFVTFVLNILPVPGFDGFGILAPYLPAAVHRAVAPIRPWAPLIVFALIWSIPQASSILFDPALWFYDLVGGSRTQAYWGQVLFQFWKL